MLVPVVARVSVGLMRRILALAAAVFAVLAIVGAAVSSSVGLAQSAQARCLATPVQGNWVYAGPLKGAISPEYDVGNGRFWLHVGAYRDRSTGLTQKIPWFVPSTYNVGGALVVRGMRLSGSRRRFTQRFNQAGMDDPTQRVFPSIIAPPATVCWRLTFLTGDVTSHLRVWVHRP